MAKPMTTAAPARKGRTQIDSRRRLNAIHSAVPEARTAITTDRISKDGI